MNAASLKNWTAVCAMATALAGCTEEPGPPPAPTKTASSAEPKSDSDNDEIKVASSEKTAYSGLKFNVPESWSEIPLSQMQMGIIAAKFSLGDGVANCTLTLSRSGGGMESNLNRWRGQFTSSRPEVVETLSVAGVDSTLIDLEGDFSPGMGRPDQPDGRMLGVIVPLQDQGYFIKLTGPSQEIAGLEDEFRSFLKSASKE